MNHPSFSLLTLAKQFNLELAGDGNKMIMGVNSLASATNDQLSFLSNKHYTKQLKTSQAGAVIVPEDCASLCTGNALIARDPYVTYAKIAALFQHQKAPDPGIHASAVIADNVTISQSAQIGPLCTIESGTVIEDGAIIGPHCIIGTNCHIGAQSHLEARVTLMDDVTLGKRVLIHPGAVLGADGFGLAMDDDHWIKVPQTGGVRIGNDCEIGANTTIDCGAISDTVLEEDVRLDNLIQIGHNVHIGAHTAMAGCSAIAGSAHIGRWCMVGGNAGILGHLEIADRTVITAKSLVTHSIRKPGQYSSGTPLQDNHNWRKNAVRFKHLDDLARRINALEREKA